MLRNVVFEMHKETLFAHVMGIQSVIYGRPSSLLLTIAKDIRKSGGKQFSFSSVQNGFNEIEITLRLVCDTH